jgi:hypothetical protein
MQYHADGCSGSRWGCLIDDCLLFEYTKILAKTRIFFVSFAKQCTVFLRSPLYVDDRVKG